ncbi:MAG: hypothetical protein V4664_00795 [Patescibacteria group bacterium]
MFRAIGFVIGLIAIRLLMPDVFHAGEHALLQFITVVGDLASHSPLNVTADATHMTAGYIVLPNTPR